LGRFLPPIADHRSPIGHPLRVMWLELWRPIFSLERLRFVAALAIVCRASELKPFRHLVLLPLLPLLLRQPLDHLPRVF
jgi:hypothetical protein